MSGLNHITGDCVAIIDDDFQNPPSEILKFYHLTLKLAYGIVLNTKSLQKSDLYL